MALEIYNYNDYKYFEHSHGQTKKALSRQLWSKVLHEKTRNKIFFRDFIGQEMGGEGSITTTTTYPPIIEKTDFKKEAGDTITLQIIKHLVVNPETSGVVGSEILLGREKSFDFGHQKVFIDLFREAAGVHLGMNLQRTPLDLITITTNQLSDFAAVLTDEEIFNAYYAGWNYTLLRALAGRVFLTDASGYITNILPTHPNTFWGSPGKIDPSQMTTSDTFSARLIEKIALWAEENNIIPIMVDGTPTWMLVIHPRQEDQLLQDPQFREALIYAKQRAQNWEHPLFKRKPEWWYGNIVIYKAKQIRTAKYYGKKVVGGNSYGLRLQTITVNGVNYVVVNSSNAAVPSIDNTSGALPDEISANNVYGALLIGGNSALIARATEWNAERRKEDDYGAFFGYALWTIWGMKRSDWWNTIDEKNLDFTTDIFNESSAVIYTYTPPIY
jgi:hypothetical protein